MKAQINLFLKDDNKFQGVYDGTPLDFAAMLHFMGGDSNVLRASLFIAVSSIYEDEGDLEMSKTIKKDAIADFEGNSTKDEQKPFDLWYALFVRELGKIGYDGEIIRKGQAWADTEWFHKDNETPAFAAKVYLEALQEEDDGFLEEYKP